MSVCPFRKGGLERFDRRLKLDVTANSIQYGRYSSDESFKVLLVLPHGFLRLRCWWITSSRRLERKGATLALAMSFVTSGVIGGPVISGSLFQLAGY